MYYHYYSVMAKDVCEKPFMKMVCVQTDENNINDNYTIVLNGVLTEFPLINIMSIHFVVTSKHIISMPNCMVIKE